MYSDNLNIDYLGMSGMENTLNGANDAQTPPHIWSLYPTNSKCYR